MSQASRSTAIQSPSGLNILMMTMMVTFQEIIFLVLHKLVFFAQSVTEQSNSDINALLNSLHGQKLKKMFAICSYMNYISSETKILVGNCGLRIEYE